MCRLKSEKELPLPCTESNEPSNKVGITWKLFEKKRRNYSRILWWSPEQRWARSASLPSRKDRDRPSTGPRPRTVESTMWTSLYKTVPCNIEWFLILYILELSIFHHSKNWKLKNFQFLWIFQFQKASLNVKFIFTFIFEDWLWLTVHWST